MWRLIAGLLLCLAAGPAWADAFSNTPPTPFGTNTTAGKVSCDGTTINCGTAGQMSVLATPGGGTVTSVAGAGGTTGLTFTGGPVTGVGTLTLGGVLVSANGGTGVNNGANTLTLGGVMVTGGALTFANLTAANDLLYVSSSGNVGQLGVTGTGNGVLATSPTIASPTVTGAFTATGLVTNADLANSGMTIGGQAISLGGTTTNQGNGSKLQLSTGTTTTNDCVKYDVNGNTVDAGAACGSGGGGITFTDGTHTVTGTTQLTVTGGTIGGSTPNGTLLITGGSATTITPGSTTISGATSPCVINNSSSTVMGCGAETGTGSFVLSGSPILSGTIGGNLTFSGNDIFSGNLTFSGLLTGTQTTCLGLTSGNVVVASSGACGTGGGGSVSITAATPNVIVTPSPLTGTGTIGITMPLSVQSGSGNYAIATTDATSLVLITNAADTTPTLAQATTSGYGSGFGFDIVPTAGPITLTPTTSTIGGLATLALAQGQYAGISSDGTNYQLALGMPPSGAANRFLATPNGSAGQPTLRAITNADLPTIGLSNGFTGTAWQRFRIIGGRWSDAVSVDAVARTLQCQPHGSEYRGWRDSGVHGDSNCDAAYDRIKWVREW